ncbi:acyltransferase family protein [Paraglaciecola arctica]|uniref:acyltransferase family protein n=1 Tax=Paraglaciecola arctica TaxID=1128911 RepID=UPI001C074370|nr:acyltransferase family protein [Paraglaciecola arctica]MBU3005726.1 acyltransferase [Paraglaciecola arctica]
MKNRVDFIDWLKAVGMFLIVFGHYFGEPFDQFTQPIYPKQLGVALFVFVMGWGLASETRPRRQVVYNRLFPMYFWGLAIAIFISVIFMLTKGHPAITNYLPFIGGINVLANFFPSNPTTWYIGTYLHILLLWALVMRKVKVTLPLILLVLLCEIAIRSIFIEFERLFTGYMLISNWITVFLLGMYMHQQKDNHNTNKALLVMLFWVLFLFAWARLLNPFDITRSFPFRLPIDHSTLISSILISVAISFVYLSNTLLAVKFFSRIPANRVVRFFSRNTIFIFIGHMPLYDVAEPIARLFVESGWGKRAIIVAIMYVGLAVVSELLHKVVNINKFMKHLWLRLN